jgi:hypothetical protein
MPRPRRLYYKEGKYFYLVKGRKRYIKVPDGMSQKQVVKINIKNISPEGRRIKRRRRRVRVKYEKPIVDGMKQAQVRPELPVYFFTPQRQVPSIPEQYRPLKIEEVRGNEDLKGVTRAIENAKQENRQLLSLMFQNLKPSQVPAEPLRLPEIERRTESIIRRAKEIRERTPVSTPMVTPMATPLREEEEETVPVREYVGVRELSTEVYLPTQLKNLLGRELTRDEKNQYKNNAITRLAIVRELKDKNPDFPDIPTSNFNTWKNEIRTQYDISLRFEGKGGSLSKGLYNDEIESVLKHRIKDFVPVIALDEAKKMVDYIKPGMKKFGFVINTNPSSSDGSGTDGYKQGHWRSVFFNNEDDFTSAEYFDPLAMGNPEPELVNAMRDIARKMNPESMFLFKTNELKRQPDGTATCGWHAMKFLDDRFQGIAWDDATGYNHYMKTHKPDDTQQGESDVKKYFRKYQSYI